MLSIPLHLYIIIVIVIAFIFSLGLAVYDGIKEHRKIWKDTKK